MQTTTEHRVARPAMAMAASDISMQINTKVSSKITAKHGAFTMIRHLLSVPAKPTASLRLADSADVTERQANRIEWIQAQRALVWRLEATACF